MWQDPTKRKRPECGNAASLFTPGTIVPALLDIGRGLCYVRRVIERMKEIIELRPFFRSPDATI